MELEKRLVAFLWSDESDQFNRRKARSSRSPSTIGFESQRSSRMLLSDPPTPQGGSHEGQMEDAIQRTHKEEGVATDAEDPAKADFLAARKARPIGLIAPLISGLSAALAVILMSFGVSECAGRSPVPQRLIVVYKRSHPHSFHIRRRRLEIRPLGGTPSCDFRCCVPMQCHCRHTCQSCPRSSGIQLTVYSLSSNWSAQLHSFIAIRHISAQSVRAETRYVRYFLSLYRCRSTRLVTLEARGLA